MSDRSATIATKPTDAIIGAGVIGLGIVWRLAACCEAELIALGRESQACWPTFAAELQQVSGIDAELRREGTLAVALTADEQAKLSPPNSGRSR